MKYEDVVACIGESESVTAAALVDHEREVISREDFCCYLADSIRRVWSGLQELRGLEEVPVLDRLTFTDVEDMCFRFTSQRPQAFYSGSFCKLDGL